MQNHSYTLLILSKQRLELKNNPQNERRDAKIKELEYWINVISEMVKKENPIDNDLDGMDYLLTK